MPGHQKKVTRHLLKILLVLLSPVPPWDTERGGEVWAAVCSRSFQGEQ